MFANLISHHIHRPGESLPPPKGPYDYVTAANGIFVRAASALLAVTIPVAPMPIGGPFIRGLAPLAPNVQIVGGVRPPSTLLDTMVRHARQQRTPSGKFREALYRLCLEPDGTLHLVVPPQHASATRVQAQGDGGARVLAEIHSHGSLGAFWSPTDDQDERGFRLYGVIGRLQDPQPEIRLRVGVYGHFWEIAVEEVFAFPRPQLATVEGSGEEAPPCS